MPVVDLYFLITTPGVQRQLLFAVHGENTRPVGERWGGGTWLPVASSIMCGFFLIGEFVSLKGSLEWCLGCSYALCSLSLFIGCKGKCSRSSWRYYKSLTAILLVFWRRATDRRYFCCGFVDVSIHSPFFCTTAEWAPEWHFRFCSCSRHFCNTTTARDTTIYPLRGPNEVYHWHLHAKQTNR